MGVSGVGGGGGGGLAVGQIRLSRGNGVPVMYNASADSAAARGTALAAAWAAFAAGETLEVGPGTYTVSSGFAILGNQTIVFNGSQITLSVAGTLFTADSVSGWSMRGNAKLIGTGAGTESGLVVTGTGREWMIDGLHFSTWNTYGLHLSATGTAGGLYRGGKMSNLYFTSCATGLRVAAISEYHTLTNLDCNSCTIGADIIGGNFACANFAIEGCTTGLYFRTGSNAAHGNWTNGSVNHCSGDAVKFEDISLGQVLTNVNVYGTASTGIVRFSNCKGVVWNGGNFVAPITIGTTPSGRNEIRGVYNDSASTRVFTGTDAQRKLISITGMFDESGPILQTSSNLYGNDSFDVGTGGTGATFVPTSGTIPFTDTKGKRVQHTGFKRGMQGRTTIKGPVDIYTGDNGTEDGPLYLRAGIPAANVIQIEGKTDANSPAIYPSSLSPIEWIRADAQDYNYGDAVAVPVDSSGLRTLSVGSTPPIFIPNGLNGLPIMRFLGTANCYIDTESFTQAQAFTQFYVCKLASTAQQAMGVSKGNNAALFYTASTTARYNSATTDMVLSGTLTNWNIFSFVVNGASSAARVNGGTAVTTNPGSAGISGGLRLGTYISGTLPSAMDFAERITIAGALTDTQVQGILQYLSTKWGIACTTGTAGAASQTAALGRARESSSGTWREWLSPRGLPMAPLVSETDRDAMTAQHGCFIRNSTTSNRLEYNDAGTWKIVNLT